MLNEDTVSPAMWARLRQGKDNIYYVSPEMALGEGFVRIWKDSAFRARVKAVIVDEAHCIEEWGDEFREQYKNLSKLRDYIGREISMVACTATCSTNTFEIIWSSLAFGFRPFWGIDVGCDRKNLSYIIKELENTGNPVLDILNLLPTSLTNETLISSIPKCLLYFNTISECLDARDCLRRILPVHLRGVVETFNGMMSEKGKSYFWDSFRDGETRILCATDAAGMGCNVPDVEYVALFSVPRSLSVLVQRWGRAGRDRTIKAACFLFVPGWAFRPKEQAVNRVTKTGKSKLLEPRLNTSRREKMEPSLCEVINCGFDEDSPGMPPCSIYK
jgi:superfamily II DNA helicase RecQ